MTEMVLFCCVKCLYSVDLVVCDVALQSDEQKLVMAVYSVDAADRCKFSKD